MGNFSPCVKISENLTNIKSATQLRKFGLFSVYFAARVVFFMHEWFDSHPSNHSCMKSFVREKNYASCEVNGKKSKFTQLRGGLMFVKFFEILMHDKKLPELMNELMVIQIGF